jgi:F420-non-reducing hydrogenase iron-sulfur subunit
LNHLRAIRVRKIVHLNPRAAGTSIWRRCGCLSTISTSSNDSVSNRMDKTKLRIYVFYCANSLDPQELTHFHDHIKDETFMAIRLPCSGKVNIPYLVKAFETGADGVVIVTCRQDECRHIEGNKRAQKRAQAVDSLIEEIGLGKGRITVIPLKETGVEQVIKDIDAFCTKVRSMPPSYIEVQTTPISNTQEATS